MCLLEVLDGRPEAISAKILATDLNEVALDKARAGVYPDNIEIDVTPERLRRFFVRSEGHYQISKAVRELCVFSRHNMATDRGQQLCVGGDAVNALADHPHLYVPVEVRRAAQTPSVRARVPRCTGRLPFSDRPNDARSRRNRGGPDNRHKGVNQWLYVVGGTGVAIVEGDRVELREGTLVLIGLGERHEIHNTGTTALKTLNVYVPSAYTSEGDELPTRKP